MRDQSSGLGRMSRLHLAQHQARSPWSSPCLGWSLLGPKAPADAQNSGRSNAKKNCLEPSIRPVQPCHGIVGQDTPGGLQ
jgi:hypothetical protein